MSSDETIFSWVIAARCLKAAMTWGGRVRWKEFFYLFAIKLFSGPGFMYKSSSQLRSKALWWWADTVVKACALGFVVFLV